MRLKNASALLTRGTFAARGALAFGGIVAFTAQTTVPRFAWKYGTEADAEDPTTIAVIRAFTRIRQETNGALVITPYLNAQLGNATAMISQTRLGALEVLAMNGGTLDTITPLASIEGIAYAFPNREAIFSALDGDLGAQIRAQFPSHGFVAMERVWENGLRHITMASKPIRRAEDLDGVKLRVAIGHLYVDTFKSLGVGTVAMDSGGVYTALQTHLVDGQEATLQYAYGRHIYEVQKYLSLSHHIWAGHWMLINKEKWDSLPRDFQEIVRKHLNENAILERQATEVLQEQLIAKFKSQGMLVNEPDVASLRGRLASSGYYARWKKEYGSTAWAAMEKYAGRSV